MKNIKISTLTEERFKLTIKILVYYEIKIDCNRVTVCDFGGPFFATIGSLNLKIRSRL